MYKVYKIHSMPHYEGFALVAANSAEEANEFIKSFKYSDRNNHCNSYGYCYIDENDLLDHLSSDIEGLIDQSIDYVG